MNDSSKVGQGDILVYSYKPRIEIVCGIDELEQTVKLMLAKDSREIWIKCQKSIEKPVKNILAVVEKTFDHERKEELESVGKGIIEVRYYKRITPTKNLKETKATHIESMEILKEDRKQSMEKEAGKPLPIFTMSHDVKRFNAEIASRKKEMQEARRAGLLGTDRAGQW